MPWEILLVHAASPLVKSVIILIFADVELMFLFGLVVRVFILGLIFTFLSDISIDLSIVSNFDFFFGIILPEVGIANEA